MMNLKELEKKLTEINDLRAELIKQIADLKVPHLRRYPENGQIYFYVNTMGIVEKAKWDSDRFDHLVHTIGNVFKTEKAAEFAAERLKVLVEMYEWGGGENYSGAYIRYHKPTGKIMIDWDGDSTFYHGDIRFKSVEDAENCIASVGEDRIKKYYFLLTEVKSDDSTI